MKKIFKTAASLAVGCALLSTSAFAALTGNVAESETAGVFTASVKKADATAWESTILVLKADSVDATGETPVIASLVNDGDIYYINQTSAKSDTATYSIAQAEEKLYVFAGGSGEDAALFVGAIDAKVVNVPVESVTLKENGANAAEAKELAIGATAAFTAEVLPANATSPAVTWSVTANDADVTASVLSVVEGVATFTAPTVEADTVYVLTATADGESDSISITVKAPKKPQLPESATIKVVAAGNAYGAESGNSLVVVSGIASGSVKIKDADGKEVEAYKADYTAAGGDCKYFAIVKGTEFATADIVYDAEGASTACLFADTSLDGELTAGDVSTALKIAAGTQATASNLQSIVVDVDANGSLTAGDVSTALKLAAGTLKVPAAVSK